MSLRINDTTPNFTARTTLGIIDFHSWIGDSLACFFSHPKDFTPGCTTELGYLARIEPEFTRRNCKLIGLSVDPVETHLQWEADIEETQGARFKVATPVNWQSGEDVIIAGSVSNDDAKALFPAGWTAPKPDLRIVAQPGVDKA